MQAVRGSELFRRICQLDAFVRPARQSCRIVFVLSALILCGSTAWAGHDAPLNSFEKAERLRDALEGRPEQQRTRGEYNRVLDAFRAVYHGDPASPFADASISAVAGLLAEEGRIFEDSKSLNDAVAEYEFLRREYPGSRYRFSGLLTEGEIYRRDLGDRDAAKSVFQIFLRLYPRNALAEQARQELAQIQVEESSEMKASAHKVPRRRGHSSGGNADGASSPVQPLKSQRAPSERAVAAPASASGAEQVRSRSTPGRMNGVSVPGPVGPPAAQPSITRSPDTRAGAAQSLNGNSSRAASGFPAPAVVHSNEVDAGPAAGTPREPAREPERAQESAAVLRASPPPRRGRLPLVTGVRHWSTPVYTRVAIDLQDEVQYEAARVPNPDRIFFDLHGARLSPELIGKSVQVTDDGFLKRIRVAQYTSDVSRVVLDVSDVSDYSAFLLPNPYRLIIDIHGRKSPSTSASANADGTNAVGAEAGKPAVGQAISVTSSGSRTVGPGPGSPPPPTTETISAPSPAHATRSRAASHASDNSGVSGINAPASKSVVTKAAVAATNSLQDVASLGSQPNRITATRRPTTAPISASVAGATAAPQPDEAAAANSEAATTSGHAARRSRSQVPSGTANIHEADPIAGGGRSLSRALGLKIGRIVVDAGHGGHDSGTLGPDGIEEKDVVLDVALRLGKMLRQRLGADVIFTRDDDTFIPLETRTAIANKAQADLFISVHANSSQDPEARGVETYYLSFTSSADALEVAARENAVSQQSIHELADLVKKIAMQDKIDESREFATDVERSLYTGLTIGQSQNAGLHDRGVKKAPFVVLIGANMPSILAEISFLTNPEDARQLRDPAYREKIAESLYLGVARYVGGLSGVRLASNGRAR